MNPCFTSVKSMSKKRNHLGSDEYYENDEKFQKIQSDDQNRKQNHSEIEKRRRDKMNNYISELSSLIPMCNAMSRKLDKLTVLRMAVQHMKTLRGPISSYTENDYKPSFLSDEELKHLILQTTAGFLFVVSCDRGRILFLSDSVSQCLNYSQSDLLGQSLFDILHPKDIPNVKEQLSSMDMSAKECFADDKSKLPLRNEVSLNQTRLCPGARRSFFCRMRCKSVTSVKEEMDTSILKRKKSTTPDRKYCAIHCTGYLKSWTPTKYNNDENEGDYDNCSLSCLVAVGQVQKGLFNSDSLKQEVELRPMEFTSRHAVDSKFLFVDQRATVILGYLPQELVGTSCYEYFHQDDLIHLAETHKQVLRTNEGITTHVYRFRNKEGHFTCLQSKWKTFHNPWTKEFEYIVSVNYLVPESDLSKSCDKTVDGTLCGSDCMDTILTDVSSGTAPGGQPHFTETTTVASTLCRQIADEVMDTQNIPDSSSNSIRFSNNDNTNQAVPNSDLQEDCDTLSSQNNFHTLHRAQDSVVLNVSINCNSQNSDQPTQCDTTQHGVLPNSNVNNLATLDAFMGREMLQASYQNSSNEGNDEAAMAVIMSLLEADAGLGGPVDFSGLPWPLP